MGDTGLLTLRRPVEIARFELAACSAVVLAQLSSLQSNSYSAWEAAIGAALLATILLASRYRRRWARVLWSGFMLFFAVIVLTGFIAIGLDSDMALPRISTLDWVLSLSAMTCNVVAAFLLWSVPASTWITRVRS